MERIKIKNKNKFFAKILSRHGSHNVFRLNIGKFPIRSVIRLGSTTILPDDKTRIQINTPQAVKNSASKLLMKQRFTEANVKTANWYTYDRGIFNNQGDISENQNRKISQLKFPIIVKSHYGSRGQGE